MKNREFPQDTALLLLGILITIGMALLMGGRTMTSWAGKLRRVKKRAALAEELN